MAMDEATRRRAEELFQRAADLPHEQRRAFLEAECGADQSEPLRAEVESLLVHHDARSHVMLEWPGAREAVLLLAETVTDQAAAFAKRKGTRVGGFTIIQEIGRGGMGVVYEAQQVNPQRAVALKVIRGGQFVDEHHVKLFQREAQALARLRHPCIGDIYEAGRTDDGEHFFAMELVRGRPLMEHVWNVNAPLCDRLILFRRICDAIHYAHQKGVMHRDLKPSNILIDADGQPKILDFGLAKITDADLAVTTVVTEVGRIAGTLQYMSPEQVRGNPDEIDIRTDVYSLGVIFYELLTDQLPYNVSKTVLHEAVRVICEAPPRRPSTRPPTSRLDTKQLSAALRGDLDWIAMKCLEKNRARRYQTASDLASDIERHLRGEPVTAAPPSQTYRIWKFVHRHRTKVSVAAVMFLLLLGGIVGTGVFAFRAEKEANEARRQQQTSEEHLWRALLDEARSVRRVEEPGSRARALSALRAAAAIRMERELRDEAILVLAMTDVEIDFTLDLGLEVVATLNEDFSLVSGNEGESIVIRTIPEGRDVLRVPGSLALLNRTGSHALVRSGGSEGWQWSLWDIASGTLHREFPEATNSFAVRFSQSGGSVWAAMPDGRVAKYDCANGSLQHELTLESEAYHVEESPDGRRLAMVQVSSDRQLLVHDSQSGKALHRLNHPMSVYGWNWSPDGRFLASGCANRNIHIWDTETERLLATIGDYQGAAIGPMWSADGKMLASSSWDASSQIWFVPDPRRIIILPLASFRAFSAVDNRIAYDDWSKQRRLQIGRLALSDDILLLSGLPASLPHPTFFIDCTANRASSVSWSGIRLWDLNLRDEVLHLPLESSRAAYLLDDGNELLVVGAAGADIRSVSWTPNGATVGLPRPLALPALPAVPVGEVALSRDENWMAYTPDRSSVVVFDIRRNESVATMGTHPRLRGIAISPDKRHVATGTWHGRDVKIWDIPSGELIKTIPVPKDAWTAFSPDGRWLAIGATNEISVHDTTSWRREHVFARKGTTGVAPTVRFSADGALLIANDEPLHVLLIDTLNWKLLTRFEAPYRLLQNNFSFSPDGRYLVAGTSLDNRIVAYDLPKVRQSLRAMNLDW